MFCSHQHVLLELGWQDSASILPAFWWSSNLVVFGIEVRDASVDDLFIPDGLSMFFVYDWPIIQLHRFLVFDNVRIFVILGGILYRRSNNLIQNESQRFFIYFYSTTTANIFISSIMKLSCIEVRLFPSFIQLFTCVVSLINVDKGYKWLFVSFYCNVVGSVCRLICYFIRICMYVYAYSLLLLHI